MRVIFMGTPDFAVPVLRGLIESKEHEVTAVVTQPDKARGRSGRLVFTPVKQVAVDAGIPVYTPVSVKESPFLDTLREIPCDVIVVVAFGQILTKEILDYPKYGCINVHASLLPRWRGAAPMQWAIMSGDDVTGITTMQMDVGLDTGDMLLTREVAISPDETGDSLHDKMSALGSDLLLETLEQAQAGTLEPRKQNDEESTYAPMLKKTMGEIDFSWDAEKLERHIRGLNSWPSAFTHYKGKLLKIWKAQPVEDDTKAQPGEIIEVDRESFTVKTGTGCLVVSEVQLEGKKRMRVCDFLRGAPLQKGDVLC